MQDVLNRGPWNIDNCLLIIKAWHPGFNVDTEDFAHTHFWMNIVGLPREMYTTEVAMKIASNFTNVTCIQLREKGESRERFF